MSNLKPPGYTAAEARAALGSDAKIFRSLQVMGVLPHKISPNRGLYPADYIDNLAALLRIGAKHGHTAFDTMVVRLWYLRYLYYDCAPPTRGLQNAHKRDINKRCAALVKKGRVIRLEAFCEMMEEFANSQVIGKWARRGRIINVKIGSGRYMTAAYVRHMRNIFAEWPTMYDVSANLGIPYQTLVSQRLRGELIAYEMPDGQMRLDPANIKIRQEAVSPDLLDLETAAARINVDGVKLRCAILAGGIEGVLVNHRLYVREDVAAYWQKRFATINPGFDWLDRESRRLGGMKRAAPKHIERLLGVPPTTLSGWLKYNLLPYYVCCFGRKDSPFKEIPIRYVEGLRHFSRKRGLPLSGPTLRQYRLLCTNRQLIV